jgi:hypothetical protein
MHSTGDSSTCTARLVLYFLPGSARKGESLETSTEMAIVLHCLQLQYFCNHTRIMLNNWVPGRAARAEKGAGQVIQSLTLKE